MTTAPSWRMRRLAVCLVIAAIAINTDAGRIQPDTKLDLANNPWGFLARAVHLWDRTGYAGQVQDQAYGYFFPLGPFFGITHSLGIPAWVAQRLWWVLLLTLAFYGLVRLAERLDIGTPFGVTVGAAAFALSPHMISVLGPISIEALPMALAPWALSSVIGARHPVRGALESALAIVCMGSVNATAVIAAIIPTAAWLATRRFDRRHLVLCASWVVAVISVSFWWMVPLLLLGRYSPPFLDYIENAPITTSVTSLVETLRGTEDWRGYLPTSGWHAATILLSQPAIVFVSGLVAGLGLLGLALRSMPHRRFFVLLVLLGVAIICAGYDAPVSGAFHSDVRRLLDGVLAPLRNVHKFDVLVRMPVALGLAHVSGKLVWGRLPIERRVTRAAAGAMMVIAVLTTAAPFVALRAGALGTFTEIPGYWKQAGSWLNSHGKNTRTLVVPGGRYGFYVWGRPKDEPLQSLLKVPWEVRDAVPMVPVDHIRMLDTVEQLLDSGTPSNGLSAYLRENGIGYLLVRNDLDYAQAGAPTPSAVHASLLGSAGIHPLTSFGPRVGSETFGPASVDYGRQMSLPALEIFSVGPTPAGVVEATSRDAVTAVVGDQDSLLGLASAGLSGPAQFVRPGVQIKPGTPVVVTDGNRRRETTFGRNDWASSATLTPNARSTINKKQRDYIAVDDPKYQATASYPGVDGFDASSSASDADALVATSPGSQPYAAFDGYSDTAWMTAPVTAPVGQFLQVNFGALREPAPLSIQFAPDSRVRSVDVITANGTRSADVDADGRVRFTDAFGLTAFVRIRVATMLPNTPDFQQVGIAEVTSPSIQVTREITVPNVLPAGTRVARYLFSAAQNGRDGCDIVSGRPLCVQGRVTPGEDAAGLNRQFVAPASGTFDVHLEAVPRPGPALDRLLARAIDSPEQIKASSRAVPDPIADGPSVLDGDLTTGWVADRADPAPSLTLTFPASRVVSALTIITDASLAATAPGLVTIQMGAATQTVPIARDGTVRMTPQRGSTLRLTFPNPAPRAVLDASSGVPGILGIGVSELRVDGLTPPTRQSTDDRIVSLPCGSGPSLSVDGSRVRTRITTTVAALRELRSLPVTVCDTGRVAINAGANALAIATSDSFRPTQVILSDITGVAPDNPVVSVRSWQETAAQVRIGARTSPAVLIVNENQNAGWQATAGGKTLARIDIGGWRQGYVVPAGGPTLVSLTFKPDDTYRIALLIGLYLAVLVLVALADLLRPSRRRADPLAVEPESRLLALLCALVGAGTLLVVGGTTGVVLFGMVAAAALLPSRRGPGGVVLTRAAIAVGYMTAVTTLAFRPWMHERYAAHSNLVQVACLVALCGLAASTWVSGRETRDGT